MLVELGAVESHDAIPSHFLRNIQRIVCRLEHFLAALDAGMWPRSDTKTHRPLQRSTFERKCILLDALPHPFSERNSRIEHGARQQQQEFFSAISADPVDFTRLELENFGELLEHLIACSVTVRVVHLLEMIDVAHHARDRLVQTKRMLEHLVQSLLE